MRSPTPYRMIMLACGLDFHEAAAFHERSESTVRKYSSGEREVPAACWAQLVDLHARILRRTARENAPRPGDFPGAGPWRMAISVWGLHNGLAPDDLADCDRVAAIAEAARA